MPLSAIECEGGGPLDGNAAPEIATVDDRGFAQFVMVEHADGTTDVYECEVALFAARYVYRGRLTAGELASLLNP